MRTLETLTFLFAVAVVAGVLHLGCASVGQPTRAQARGAVLAAAEAISATDQTCAAIAYQRRDRDMALHCAHAYDVARAAIVVSATAVDHWDTLSSSHMSVACSMRSVLDGLAEMVHELRDAGVGVPSIVEDAQALSPIVGVCPDDVPHPLTPPTGDQE